VQQVGDRPNRNSSRASYLSATGDAGADLSRTPCVLACVEKSQKFWGSPPLHAPGPPRSGQF